MRLHIEGWRGYTQSLALINQYQCLALLDRPDVRLTHADLATPPAAMLKSGAAWRPVAEILGGDADRRVRAIPPRHVDDPPPDATYRIGFPYDFSSAPHGVTRVFAVTETGGLPDFLVRGPSLAEATRRDGFGIVTLSSFSRDGLVASGADPRRVSVVPGGFDPATFRPLLPEQRTQARGRLGWGDRFVFLGVGAMYPHKGVRTLLKAFAVVAATHPGALLVLKGDDAVYASSRFLQTVIGDLSPDERERLAPRVRIVNRTFTAAQLALLYQSADAYVSPYHAEGFNLPVIEAAACGLPVICTAGGPTDETTDERFALRIPSTRGPSPPRAWPGTWLYPDPEALAALMTRAMDDPAFVAEARRAGPAHVNARYTWRHVAEALLASTGHPARV